MIEFVQRKSFAIRESKRSTDFISPSFGHGCLYNCTYCYMKRHKDKGLSIAKNTEEILTAINNHAAFLHEKEPNQCDPKFWTYDISCNEDFALHAKYHDWRNIFRFFKEHKTAKASFATKYVNKELLLFDPKQKVRIRFSLIPEHIRRKLEPNTSSIKKRVGAINQFVEAGYEVHVNFSPVVVYKNWENDYRELMIELDKALSKESKNQIKAEVIFLTHNHEKHKYNVSNDLPGEELLWTIKNQESKKSEFGGNNIRYRWDLKKLYVNQFKNIMAENIPYCDIRYIF